MQGEAHRAPASLDRSCATCSIAPPHILARFAEEGDEDERRAALKTIVASGSIRSRRGVVTQVVRNLDAATRGLAFLRPPAGESRTVFDVQHGTSAELPGQRVRGDGDAESDDPAVNQAYDGSGDTYDYYREVHERDSVDGNGLELVSTVHFGNAFDNAFWNGTQMVYGDGSGQLFRAGSLTESLDVIAHELTHGVTQFTAGLEYRTQSGALNESFSDVFGSLVKQWKGKETADQADWLIGEGIFAGRLEGQSLRSLKSPGDANDFDNQPARMSDFVELPDDNDPANDNGGVHINSGIPNHAFFLVATALGGHAWEKAGRIWYGALTARLQPDSDFAACAEATLSVAEELFGTGAEHDAVGNAWREVGVL
ncbi:MAG TPA: M4 family metallopeptidase [Thermoleophilaceae bacterium]|jgi:Zn-dependent metalloprotease